MNLVDSSGWLEYFADGKNADFFAPAILKADDLVVSVINIYEVFKRVLRQRGEDAAFQAVAAMQGATVVPLDETLAISAARISAEKGIPMADSMILATARAYSATLWTQDADFEGLNGVKYVRKDGQS